MAKTQVDTVQAGVSEYGDDGNILDVTVATGKTSALSIAVPPALSFKRVHLEGSFVASEFSAADHSNVNVNLIGVGVSSRGLGIGGPAVSASFVNSNTDIQTQQTQDSSVASMSMTVEIRPKPVTTLPKPPLVFKGPRLTLTSFRPLALVTVNPGPSTTNPDDPPALYRRSVVVQVQLLKPDTSGTGGQFIADDGQIIAIDGGALDWDVTDNLGGSAPAAHPGPTTYSDSTTTPNIVGAFYITVSRNITSKTEPNKDFVVRGSLNLLNTTCSISL
jgi:hypothetical protein